MAIGLAGLYVDTAAPKDNVTVTVITKNGHTF